MAGSKAGAAKAKAKLLAKDPDYFKKLGMIGGKAQIATKGFGTHKDKAAEFGKQRKK